MMVKAPTGSPIIKKYLQARKKALTNNAFSQVASPGAPRTTKAGPKNSNGPKGGSSKTKVKVTTKLPGKTLKKARKVSKTKLNTTPKTPFNRSSRVNYRQLRGK